MTVLTGVAAVASIGTMLTTTSTPSHGTRLAPPNSGRQQLLRPRLLELLQARFRTRLTTVTAGPGFGKTSLMAQAVAENRLSPRGADVWVTCRDSDNAASSLAGALCAAFELSDVSWDSQVVVDRVADQIWSRSPEQFALILDEAHVIRGGSQGAELLGVLLERLPGNAHLVLLGRDHPPVPTARLAALGQLTELREQDLAFTADELDGFASLRDVPVACLEGIAGWPALAELSASTGGDRVLDFLWEELLAKLPSERRHDLAALSLVDAFDDELAAALVGREFDLGETLADLPLVSGRPGAERSLHPLWRPALAKELTPDEAAAARTRAAAALRRRGEVDAAVRLLAAAGSWSRIREVVSETALHTHPLVAPDLLERWYRQLPTRERQRPEGVLLRALVARAHDLRRALPLFTRAAQGFHEAGNVVGEVACLTHAAHIAWWLDDLAAVDAAVEGVLRLEAEAPWLAGVAALGRVLAADARGEPEAALDVLAGIDPGTVPASMASGLDWMWAWELILSGVPERARAYAQAAVDKAPGTFMAPSLDVLTLATWQSGDMVSAHDLLPRFAEASVATGRDLGTVFERSQCGLLTAFAGRPDRAREHLDAAALARPGASGAGMAEIALALGRAALLVASGEEDAARLGLVEELAARPLGGIGATRWHHVFPTLSYVLVEDARGYWDGAALGPAQTRGIDLARALVALRTEGRLDRAAALDLSDHGRTRAHLPLPWLVELAVAALAGGSVSARDLLGSLSDAELRPWLRPLAGMSALAPAVKALVAQRPHVPGYTLELRVLGTLELARDGIPVDHPDLRRDRVRHLLEFLVVRGQVSRAACAAELWPDLEPEAAARNLRVTLAYAQRVLEPDRADGDAPTFLRTDGRTLHLWTGESLRIDLHEFDAALDAAAEAERAAAPSVALGHLTQALARYRGECFSQHQGSDWADLERDRVRLRFVAALVRVGELRLAIADLSTPAALAVQALHADPCSEAAYRLLVAAHLELGELDQARQIHRRCLRMLADLGVPPSEATQTLARRLESVSRPGDVKARVPRQSGQVRGVRT